MILRETTMAEKKNAIALVDEQKMISVLQNSLYPGAAPESIAMVLSYCKARGLDPFQKPVHIVPMWDSKLRANRDVIMPGLNLYRTQAAESGLLAGIDDVEFGPMTEFEFSGMEKEGSFNIKIKAPEWAKVSVRRMLKNGEIGVFSATEFFEEAISTSKSGKPTPMWIKRPRGMLSKTAESQALRKAFPDLNAAETAEEMEGKSIDPNDAPAEKAEPSAEQQKIIALAYQKAQEGVDAYTMFWASIPKDERQLIKEAYPQGLMNVAKAADDARTVEAQQ